MSKGRYEAPRKGFGIRSRTLVLALAVVLAVGCVVGGTIAWLTDESDPVVNTFTPSSIGVDLTETEREYKMIPGWTIDKDPAAAVTEGSEACYLFVKAEESDNFGDYMEYTVDSAWTKLEDGVYYMIVDGEDGHGSAGTAYPILKDDQVTVLDTVTEQMMEALTADTKPTLTFTAYAVQLYKTNNTAFTPAEAWEIAQA